MQCKFPLLTNNSKMNNRILRLCVIVGILVVSSASNCASAESSSPTNPLASRLAALMLNDAMYAEILNQAGTAAAVASRHAIENALKRKLDENEVKVLGTIWRDSVKEVVPKSQWIQMYEDLILRILNEQEIKVLIEFYENPVSRKSPELMARGAAAGVDLMKKHQEEVGKLFLTKFEKAFPNISR